MTEDKSISLTLYKIFLIFIKYGPFIIGIASFISVILGCVGITFGIFSSIFQLSVLSTITWIIASFTFKCCTWHRLPLYYCWVNNVISWIDFNWTIPINNLQMILIYSIIALLFVLLGMYFKNQYNVRKRSKGSST